MASILLTSLLILLKLTHALAPPPLDCSKIAIPGVPGAAVKTVASAILENVVVASMKGLPALNFNGRVCEVNVFLNHPGENDNVLVQTWLPLDNWNQRFQGTGGGGFSTGMGQYSLAQAAQLGYSASQTDGGHVENFADASWALNSDGKVDMTLLQDFASRSIHDMTVVGKQITSSFYRRPLKYSYWNGCSTGGRQGFMEAQKYPEDYNGILAEAPAFNWDRFVPAEIWPQIVMKQTNTYPTSCELSAFTNVSIIVCDSLDGVTDGLISNPDACSHHFNPHTLVGTTPSCANKSITAAIADVVQKIHDGPRDFKGNFQWYGLEWGTTMIPLADSTVSGDGQGQTKPFSLATDWIAYWLKKNPKFDLSTLSYSDWDNVSAQSVGDYSSVIGTDNPDLTSFRDRGGRLLSWHGLADQLIFPNGSIDYRRRVDAALGSKVSVNNFYRLSLAPGVEHCSGGIGPVPVDPLSALVTWVEEGKAPDVLSARSGDGSVTRNLCPWPLTQRYNGGDVKKAESLAVPEAAPAPSVHSVLVFGHTVDGWSDGFGNEITKYR
jgi:Tannase and feruloyl esterase